MAGRLYRMAKVVSANPKSWGIIDANEISGFKRVAKLSDLYSIAECILSSSYGDGVTDGVDAVGQIWHVSETDSDYKLTNWANRKSAAGWTKLSYGGDVSAPVKDVHVNNVSVLSNGVANINLTDYAKKSDVTNNLKNYIAQAEKGVRNGVAPLDRDNMIPLKYLGHLDTTVYKVLGTNEALPTTGIKSCIYLKLIEAGNPTGDNNKYAEYVYTGDIAGTYDATKWEKLGEVTSNISGSAPTVDAAMSETSTNAVQNKVIDNAIKTHKIDANNFNSIVNIADGTTRLLFFNKEDGYVNYKDDNRACYLISNETIDADKGVPKIGYSEDGSVATSYLLRDIDMVALTDTELNEILK